MRVTPESLARGIPAEWRLAPLKYQVERLNEKNDGSNGVDSPYVGLENIGSWTGTYVPGESEAGEGMASTFGAGDVLFGKLRPYLAKVWLAGFAGRCTSEALVLRGRTITPHFLKYLLLAHPFINLVDASTYGAKMPRAEWEFIGNINVPVPPERAQRRIANFLDRKTAAIDELIRKKERLIELLQEKRQALITEAVTKGLDRSVPMKDSGVDWIGRVPEHWRIVPLRWFIRVASGDFIPNEDYWRDRINESDRPVIGGNGVSGWTRRSNQSARTVVVGRVGAHCGNVHLVDAPCWITDNALRLFGVQGFDLEYLGFALRSAGLNRHADQNAQPLITGSKIKEQLLPHPSLQIQRQIVSSIGRRTARMDRTQEVISSQVERLREYRQALITAAVTGKLEVA